MILDGKGVASIVITPSIEIAKTQYVVVVDIAARYGEVGLLEERDGGCRPAHAEQSNAFHLHGFAVGRILGNSFRKCLFRRLHLAFAVESHATQALRSRRFGLLNGESVQNLQCIVKLAMVEELLCFRSLRKCRGLRIQRTEQLAYDRSNYCQERKPTEPPRAAAAVVSIDVFDRGIGRLLVLCR